MRRLRLLPLLCLCVPVFAFSEADRPALEAIVRYGESHLDPASGLITDAAGVPNVPESSGGYVAACLATGQQLERAQAVLTRLLALQQATGPETGAFPWQAVQGAPASTEATLYVAPLLAYSARHHGAALGADLQARLNAALDLALKACNRIQTEPGDETRFLLRAAARGNLAAALGLDPAPAAADVAAWFRLVTGTGLPAGHSATFDAVKFVALKWVRDSLPEAQRQPVERALLLVAADLAGRVHPDAGYLAGALSQAFPADYADAAGFPRYVLHTDFGLPLPESVEPYLAMALLPQWRTPEGLAAVSLGSGMRRTHSTRSAITATDTYIGQAFSLGTFCGEVGSAGIPLLCTFGRTARPTAYAFCTPVPATVQSVQADNLALCSFNFDNVGTVDRKQAAVNLVLGTKADINEVRCYGAAWNGQPTSIGELESMAILTRDCYVGLTIMRTGSAAAQQGSPARPAILNWTQPDGTGDLMLTIYARQAEYALVQPQHNMRAGFVIEIVPQSAYPTLTEFTKHLAQGRLKQNAAAVRERVEEKEKPKPEHVIIPEPQSKVDRVYRSKLQQTVEYTLEGRTLTLLEDLIGNVTLERKIDGVLLSPGLLWESDYFKLEPKGDVSKALAEVLK